jgi:hypothetical protein
MIIDVLFFFIATGNLFRPVQLSHICQLAQPDEVIHTVFTRRILPAQSSGRHTGLLLFHPLQGEKTKDAESVKPE